MAPTCSEPNSPSLPQAATGTTIAGRPNRRSGRPAHGGLVELGDIDGLIELVGSLCFDEQWQAIVELRDDCVAAASRGKQLWPAASYAEYRLALDAPASLAVTVADSPFDRFALGPFTEVVASSHEWAPIAAHSAGVPTPAMAAMAQERIIRGEDLRGDRVAEESIGVYELPLVLLPWEPRYFVAEYRPAGAEFPAPGPLTGYEPLVRLAGGAPVALVDDRGSCDALLELVAAWTQSSNGRAEAVVVEGPLEAAIGALGPPRARITRVEPAEALGRMAWAAASGGAHGRRRGAAAARSQLWWVAAELTGLSEPGGGLAPDQADALGEAIGELEWAIWDDGSPDTGWSLRLALSDPADGLAWALAAIDAV